MFNMKSYLLVLSAISSFVYAYPSVDTFSEKNSRTNCKTYTDTFDNYTTVLVTPELSPVNFDGGLFYSFDASGTTPGSGIIPASSPNVAAASVNQDLAKFGVVTLNPFGVITTSGTATKYFELVSFYYACSLSTNGVPVPTGCGLTVSGFNIYGQRVGSAAFNYAPLNSVVANMELAILPLWFIYLQNVTIAISDASVAVSTTVLYIDNVTHINCY